MEDNEFESNEAKRQRLLGIQDNDEIHASSDEIKKGNFFANLWYKHKWAIILSSILIVIFVIVGVQMAKKDNYDITIIYAGPQYLYSEQHDKVSDTLKFAMKDYNGDGEKKILLSTITYQTEEQRKKAYENDFYGMVMSNAANKQSLDTFMNQIMSGLASVYLLDPSLYEMYKNQFENVSELLGYTPDESVMYGENGVYLKKTAFSKYYAGFADLPDDTVICVLKKLVTTRDETQKNGVDFFKSVMDFETP